MSATVGFHEMNTVIIGLMRNALMNTGRMMFARMSPSERTDSFDFMNNLAMFLNDRGERAEARRLYEEVIAGRTEQLGPSHTQTLEAKNNLANLLKTLGKRAEARRLYEEAPKRVSGWRPPRPTSR